MTLEKKKKKKLFLKTTGSLIERYFSFDGGLSDEKRGLEILGEERGISFNSNIISRKLSGNVFAKDVSYKREYYVG